MSAQGPWPMPGPNPFDHAHAPRSGNPLRRRSDRLESWFGVFLLLVLLVALPVLSLRVGFAVHASEMRVVHSESAERHQVNARLTADASATTHDKEAASSQKAPVRWSEKDGTKRLGTARVAPGSNEGSTVRIWVDHRGSVTSPPTTSTAAVGAGWMAGAMTGAAIGTSVLASRLAVRYVLNRRRYARWEAEWASLEPQWSERFRD
ncbi:Rv1733c family protein [Streptomyces sp. TP-A0874]|uniref:Rv1733c family protein n=1 Tax=Streptomyces sp. TP-A0874 TaxID=549819 RepID=UPI000853E684|nr:hypothetical protein [Streptomyces sp. TP-A0874]